MRSLQKFLEPERNPKVIYTDNSLVFGKACEDFSWNHCTYTQHPSGTDVIADAEVRKVEESISALLLQSGLNESWWQILWNVTPICETSQFHLMGRRLVKDILGNHLKTDRSILFIGWGSSQNCERQVKNPSIWKKSLTWIVPRIRSVRGGEFGRVTYWSATLRSWKPMDASEIYSKRLNAKEVIFPKETGESIFPIADGRIKTPGRDQELRTSTLIRPRPIQKICHVDFLEE